MNINKFAYEKINDETVIPENILNLYKIEGYEEVAYKNFIRSKRIFESKSANSEISEDYQNSFLKTKNEISKQAGEQRVSLIIKALENSDIEMQRIGASMIQKAPEAKKEDLGKIVRDKIINALNNSDIQIQRIAMNMIQFAPPYAQAQLKEIVFQRIINTFNSGDVSKERIMAKKIDLSPEEEQDFLRNIVYKKVLKALDREDIKIQRLGAVMIQYAPRDKRNELMNAVADKFKLAQEQGRYNEIVEPPLYLKSQEKSDSTFSRDIFSKTGSKTTLLLGKQFQNNLIIRHIEEPCFRAWIKAYESHSYWTNAGFNYVPIEPIYSYSHADGSGLIDTASGILDVNLEEWYAFSGNTYKDILDEQKTKILNVLARLNINHGHANDANFCLRFFREQGIVDIKRIPKIYLIDFDKAAIY